MSFRSNFLGALAGGLVLVAIAAGMYYFTETGRTLVDNMFDRAAPVKKSARVTLMSPFKSYMNISEAKSILSSQQVNIETSHNIVPKIQNVPAKVLDTVTADSFMHHGVQGKLTLEFLNNELYEVEFNPYIAKEYVSVARNKLGLRPNPAKNGRSEKVIGNKRISSNIFLSVTKVGASLRTKPYVLWQDLHLLMLRRQ